MVLVTLAALGPAAQAQARGCTTPHGARLVRANADVRVWLDAQDQGVACLRATGRRTRLYEDDGLYRSGRIRRVAGRFVAYSTYYTPECKNMCPPGVVAEFRTVLFDARSRRRTRLSSEGVAKVVLSRAGTAAWLTGAGASAVLHLREDGAARVLDRGDIPVRSLALSGGVLRWTRDGAEQRRAVS